MPDAKIQKLLALLSSAGFVLLLYTFVHESGHALAILLFGGRVTGFNINFTSLSAHVSGTGQFNPLQEALKSLAGPLLPLLVWALVITLAPRRANWSLEALKTLSTLVILSTLVVWVFLPLLYLSGRVPAGDDVTRFLDASGLPPLLVSLLSALLIAASAWLYGLRSAGFRQGIRALRLNDDAILTHPARITTRLVLLLSLAGLALADMTGAFTRGDSGFAALDPPSGYRQVAELDLSRLGSSEVEVARLSLDRPASVGVFLALRSVNTSSLDIDLRGPDGVHHSLFHAQGFYSDHYTTRVQLDLPAGEYPLLVSGQASRGKLLLYLKFH